MNNIATRKLNHFVVISVGVFVVLVVLMLGMLIGRLELYPIILLLVPETWKRK